MLIHRAQETRVVREGWSREGTAGDQSGQGGVVQGRDSVKSGREFLTKWERKHVSRIAFSAITQSHTDYTLAKIHSRYRIAR